MVFTDALLIVLSCQTVLTIFASGSQPFHFIVHLLKLYHSFHIITSVQPEMLSGSFRFGTFFDTDGCWPGVVGSSLFFINAVRVILNE